MRHLLFALCPLLSAFPAQPQNMLLGTQAIGEHHIPECTISGSPGR